MKLDKNIAELMMKQIVFRKAVAIADAELFHHDPDFFSPTPIKKSTEEVFKYSDEITPLLKKLSSEFKGSQLEIDLTTFFDHVAALLHGRVIANESKVKFYAAEMQELKEKLSDGALPPDVIKAITQAADIALSTPREKIPEPLLRTLPRNDYLTWAELANLRDSQYCNGIA